MVPKKNSAAAAMENAAGLFAICEMSSLGRFLSVVARVTMMPAAVETTQRRELSDQAITNSQQGIHLGGFGHRQVLLKHTDSESSDYVDQRDENTGNGITPDKPDGTRPWTRKNRLPVPAYACDSAHLLR